MDLCPAPWAHGGTAPLLGSLLPVAQMTFVLAQHHFALEGPLPSPPVTYLPKQCHELGPKCSILTDSTCPGGAQTLLEEAK